MKPTNNCETCKHKKTPQGGHCYMFQEEPDEMCHQHTDFQQAKKDMLNTRHRSALDNTMIRLSQIKFLLNAGIGAGNSRLVSNNKDIEALIAERKKIITSQKESKI